MSESIVFSLPDALSIALLHARIAELNASIASIIQKYEVPNGWIVTFDFEGHWIGAEPPVELTLVPEAAAS